MKVLAAHRSGLKFVVLPEKNRRDLDDLPPEVVQSMEFVTLERLDKAIVSFLLVRDGGDEHLNIRTIEKISEPLEAAAG